MSDVERQLEAARNAALVVPDADRGTLVVTGPDRISWLNGLVTCDLSKLRPGQAALGLAVAKNGKVQAELRILAGDDRVVVGLSRDRLPGLRETFEHHLIMEDAELADASDKYAWLTAHGPAAAELVAIARANGALAAPLDLTGLGGALIAAPASALGAVATALSAQSGVAVGDCEAWDRLRVERMFPAFGKDYDDQSYPQEASIEKIAVSFEKGCYLGQETVCMLELRGHVKKKLVQLAVASDPASLAPRAPVALSDGTEIGVVTSVAPGPRAGEALALGYVKYKHAHSGTELLAGGHPATITRTHVAAADPAR